MRAVGASLIFLALCTFHRLCRLWRNYSFSEEVIRYIGICTGSYRTEYRNNCALQQENSKYVMPTSESITLNFFIIHLKNYVCRKYKCRGAPPDIPSPEIPSLDTSQTLVLFKSMSPNFLSLTITLNNRILLRT